MTTIQRIATAILTLALAALVGAGAWWLVNDRPGTAKSDKPTPPATVAKVVKEDDLNTVTLTEAAEKRLGLTLAAVESKAVRRVRVYGGEVTIPVGRTILVAAPVGGQLKAPVGGVPPVGQRLKAGQPVFQLLPLLTPDGRATLSASLADADGQVNNAKTQVELTRIALDRANRVLKEGAGSQRQVDEARAAFDLATTTLDAVAARRTILANVVGDVDAGTAAPIPLDAPQGGLLRAVSALPGQTVPAGGALFEVVDLSTLWVRVPVPVGDLDGLDRTAPALVGRLSASPEPRLTSAKPVDAPPTATALSGTVDEYYALPNPTGTLTPGQRLGVTIPLKDSGVSPTVPWSAVMIDIHGGTWVYVPIAPRTYVRRRVVVRSTVGSDAVLVAGLAAGTSVVATGGQELFGAETGFIK